MKLTQKIRFEIAVYLALASLAISMAIISDTFIEGTVKAFVISVASGLFGVAILFFLLNRLFGITTGPEDVKHAIVRLAEERSTLVSDNAAARKLFHIDELLKTTRSLWIVGYNVESFLNHFRDSIVACVQRGGNVRILIIDPASKAREVIRENSSRHIFEKNLSLSFTHASYITDHLKNRPGRSRGRFELKLTKWIPSCAMIIVNPKFDSGTMKVSVNTPHYDTPRGGGRLNMIFRRSIDRYWFNYFVIQYERLWEEAVADPARYRKV